MQRSEPVLAISVVGLTTLLISPISWSHHWVWVVVLLAALATRASHDGDRFLGVALGFLTAVFLAVPGHLDNQSLPTPGGLLWYVPYRDNREYHWHSWQLIIGNIELLAGAVVLCVLVTRICRTRWALR